MESKGAVGVIGAGTIGNGIAQAFASAGYPVLMYDISEAALKRGRAAIESSLGKLVKKENIDQAGSDSILRRIQSVTALPSVKDCKIVIEAATENPSIKSDLFRELDKLCPADAILATNSSSISITRLASTTTRPSW